MVSITFMRSSWTFSKGSLSTIFITCGLWSYLWFSLSLKSLLTLEENKEKIIIYILVSTNISCKFNFTSFKATFASKLYLFTLIESMCEALFFPPGKRTWSNEKRWKAFYPFLTWVKLISPSLAIKGKKTFF